MKVAVFTWQGGGATQPAFGIGRILVERGHEVRIVGPAAYAERAAAVGCGYSPVPPELEFDPAKGRAAEEQRSYLEEIFLGPGPPRMLTEELAREPADLLVVDYLMRSTIDRTASLGVPTVVFFHTLHRFHGDRHGADLARRATAALVAMPGEFDPWPADAAAAVTHVGPIFEEAEAPTWDSPWSADDKRPLVVVTMGSTYMHQEELLTRVAGVLAELGLRVLVLTGLELGAGEMDLGPDIVVRDFVPHSAVFPDADLVVTHAGIGTLMAAFAAGVPLLCTPLGRDQGLNAERVEELGAGITLPPDATPEQIREAVVETMGSPSVRAAAARMAEAIAGYETARWVGELIEGAVGRA